MLKNINCDNPVINVLKKFFGDVVLVYTALIMMSLMYHYRSSLDIAYGFAALVIGALLFRLFDFIAKHKIIGTVAYIAVFVAFLFIAGMFIDIGAVDYPLSFGVWFLTPQDALDYSKYYTMAIFMLFMIFMASVIYYFTKIRYRIFMNFLIFIIPFALYGKEYEKMPTIYIMLLAIGYIVIMINCRQINEREKVKIVNKNTIWRSTAAYIIVFASFASIIPKPKVEADRQVLETLIYADRFTDNLMNMLTVFQDTTTSEQFGNINDESPLYFVSAEESLRLKTLTFSTYNYTDDSWSVTKNDTRFSYTDDEKSIVQPKTGALLEAIMTAAKEDAEFAKKYGLDKYTQIEITSPPIKSITINTVNSSAQFAPVPQNMTALKYTTSNKQIALILSGLVYCTDGRFNFNETFQYNYCSDNFFENKQNRLLTDLMSREDYKNFLIDAAAAISFKDEYTFQLLKDEYLSLNQHNAYLDYGNNNEISLLADEITAGLDTDYEKALAIEQYFIEKEYIYDLNYNKKKGENAVDFLYKTNRGVCAEFATAMTLLSRAAGIPARYCIGYNMSTMYENTRLNTNYVIRSKDAHAFPELYIRGVGWISFEPTVSSSGLEQDTQNATRNLSKAGLMLLIASLLFLLCVIIYPVISHKILLIRINKSDSSKAVILIMRRIMRLYKTESSMTSQEVARYIFSLSGCDITLIADAFDDVVYGKKTPKKIEINKLTEVYINAYKSKREIKRKRMQKA